MNHTNGTRGDFNKMIANAAADVGRRWRRKKPIDWHLRAIINAFATADIICWFDDEVKNALTATKHHIETNTPAHRHLNGVIAIRARYHHARENAFVIQEIGITTELSQRLTS